MKTSKGELFEFNDHRFLIEPLEDLTPIQATIKCSQIGFSETTTLKVYWAADQLGASVIYTLPTSDGVNDFVSSKVNPIISNNSVLQNLIQDKDSIQQKKVGNSFVFYRGTHSGKSSADKMESGRGITITADINIHDESDRSDQTIIEQYESRLANSKLKWRWYFSNPTAPGIGAHKYFLLSDQKHWFVKCACGLWQYLDWPVSIDMKRGIFVCRSCGGEITDDMRRNGKWVKKFKNRDISGYWISQLMNPRTSAKDIILAYQTKDTQYFYNFVLGLPYKGSDVVVDRQAIINNIVLTENNTQNAAIGVDNGIEKHYVIGNEQGIFEIGKTKDWDVIERLKMKYQAKMVIDLNPYPKFPKSLVDKYRGEVWCSFFKKDKDKLGIVEWGEHDKRGMVYSDRNKIIQEAIDMIVDGGVSFNMPESALEEFIAHWDNIYQTVETDNLGIPHAIWNTVPNRPDHYCLVGETKITIKDGNKEIKDVKSGDEVLTRQGWKKVLKSWKTQDNAKTMSVYFSNGQIIKATPDHLIWVNNEFRPLRSTIYGDVIESEELNKNSLWNQKQSYLKILNSEGIQNQKKEVPECISLLTEQTEQKGLADYTKKFGNLSMGKFLSVSRYIILMVIRLITRFQTWCVCQEENIRVITLENGLKIPIIEKNKRNIYEQSENIQVAMLGTEARKEDNGIANTLKARLYCLNLKILSVLSAGLRLLHKAALAGNFAEKDVSIVGMHENGERNSVYNLTIEDCPEYYANGILLHNCFAFIYWKLAMMRAGQNSAVVGGRKQMLKGAPSFEVKNETMPAPDMNELFKKKRDWRY